MQLKRVEVIPDDEEDIVEAVQRMSSRYDFVVTSGGIGPTCVHPSASAPDSLAQPQPHTSN
jgi:molybdopterin-biosynthesis enzyme MoeA-like protein